MTPLKPWSKEPESYHLLAIYRGDRREVMGFLQSWLRWAGHLDLTARTFAPALLSRNGNDAPPELALATPIDLVPAYFLVNWWLERPERWRLFYQPFKKPYENKSSAPAGVYLPWGYCIEPHPTSASNPGNGAAILWENGKSM